MQTRFTPIVMTLMLASVGAHMQAAQKQLTTTSSYYQQAKDLVGDAAGKAKDKWNAATPVQKVGVGALVVGASAAGYSWYNAPERRKARQVARDEKRSRQAREREDIERKRVHSAQDYSREKSSGSASSSSKAVSDGPVISKGGASRSDGDRKEDAERAARDREAGIDAAAGQLDKALKRNQLGSREKAGLYVCVLGHEANAVRAEAERRVSALTQEQATIRALLEDRPASGSYEMSVRRSDDANVDERSVRKAAEDALRHN